MKTELNTNGSWLLEPLMSIDELADYLGMPVSTLYDWRSIGKGPVAHRLGKHLKYAHSNVAEWLADQRDDARGTVVPNRQHRSATAVRNPHDRSAGSETREITAPPGHQNGGCDSPPPLPIRPAHVGNGTTRDGCAGSAQPQGNGGSDSEPPFRAAGNGRDGSSLPEAPERHRSDRVDPAQPRSGLPNGVDDSSTPSARNGLGDSPAPLPEGGLR